jgi:hypothetical protein
MSERIVSPGVFTRENDLSFLTQGIGQIGAAVIGPFHKGPAFVPTVIRTQADFESIFGTPDGTYYTGKTVRDYLTETGLVTIVRVGHIGGYTQPNPFGIAVTGSNGLELIGTFHSTHVHTDADGLHTDVDPIVLDVQAGSTEFSISGSLLGIEISASVLPEKSNDITDVFGSSAKGNKNAYVYTYFPNTAKLTSESFQTGAEIVLVDLPNQEFTQDVTFASTPWIQSQLISGERYDLFRFHTLGDGSVYNREYKISIYNIRPAGSVTSTNYALFSVAVRGFSDTDKNQNVLEVYNNVNLDPASANYLPKVIGDRNLEIDANGKQTENGDYPNRSKFIRVEVKPEGSFPVTAAPFAHEAYTNPVKFETGDNIVTSTPPVIFSTGSFNNTSTNTTRYAGIDLETAMVRQNNHNYLNPIPADANSGINTAFSFDANVYAMVDGNVQLYNFGFQITGSNQQDINKRQFTVAFQGGFDGVSPTRHFLKAGEIAMANGSQIDIWGEGNSQGFDMATSTSSGSVAYVKGIRAISNPDDYDINLVVAPGVVRSKHPYVFDTMVDMVETRADAFFIGDLVGIQNVNGKAVMDSISLVTEQASTLDSSYVGTYYPWVKVVDTTTNRLVSVPPSVLMPAVYAANDAVAAEWFAPAGLNRGGIVGAVSVLNKLTHSERDILYENKVNPIASFPGEGIVAFGQKTLQERSSALDRINVRRLLIKVKKFFASTSRYLVFEQNSSQTRNAFLNTVTPYLESIQQRQGLYSFRVVMDETNNTPDVIDRNILVGQIYLQPTRTAEFIILDFNILPTGATFNV